MIYGVKYILWGFFGKRLRDCNAAVREIKMELFSCFVSSGTIM